MNLVEEGLEENGVKDGGPGSGMGWMVTVDIYFALCPIYYNDSIVARRKTTFTSKIIPDTIKSYIAAHLLFQGVTPQR